MSYSNKHPFGCMCADCVGALFTPPSPMLFQPGPTPRFQPLPKVTRRSKSQQRKEMPVFSGVMMYFPDAMKWVSRVSFNGNEKHNPGKHLHWAHEKSTDHMDCLARHTLDYNDFDSENGAPHMASAIWRAAAQLQMQCYIWRAMGFEVDPQ